MKKNIKYLAILALGLVACEPEFDTPIDEAGVYTSGNADFSTYVALGNSLTAGFADNALYISGQENSYPNILSKQFALAGGGEFIQPLMSDDIGGFSNNTNEFGPRLVLTVGAGGPTPVPYTGGQPSTDFTNRLTGSFNNMGIPGAKSYHLGAPGYGNLGAVALGLANPYFARFASSDNATVLEDALAQSPTFFTLWIGNNDILSYATSGGVGADHNETGELDPANYGSLDITNNITFDNVYKQLVAGLISGGAQGVLINLPEITSSPFFTTVPNNALVLDEAQATNLTGFFQAFVGIATQVLASPPSSIPLAQAQAIAAQYAIQFKAGSNRFLIKETPSDSNPFGFRQMTEDELLLLTIDREALGQGYGSVVLSPEVLQVLGLLQQGGSPTPEQGALVIDAVSAIDDKDALDSQEINAITSAHNSYNTTIEAVADDNGLAFLDIAAILDQAANGGFAFNGGVVTSDFVTGGGFSLDGVHPTPRAHAIVANALIDVIKKRYKANVPVVSPADFGTITFGN